jgi:asparagine synthase (glutamine-hydrolysing)
VTALTPLEVATGIVFGSERPEPLSGAAAPADALAAAVRPALARGRCFVSFSGGRDSSTVLAAAATVARREGLPAPVPLTVRAAGAPEAEESEWQEAVVRHLGLDDWVRVDVDGELDAVGPYARRVLARHGLLWPFNVHFHLPLLERAAGGTLLTGIGGDELWAASAAPRLRLRRRALRFAPLPVRRAVLARREPIGFPWLRPAAVRAARRSAGGHTAAEPHRLAHRMAWWRAMRAFTVGTGSLDRVAADAGAAIAHPLLDRGLWGAVATAAPHAGFVRRDDALAIVAGAHLPAEVVARRTKASFDAVFFSAHARAFAARWAGEGIPEDLVDAAALRRHWAGEPDAHSLTLLQAAWLGSAGERGQQPVGHLAH